LKNKTKCVINTIKRVVDLKGAIMKFKTGFPALLVIFTLFINSGYIYAQTGRTVGPLIQTQWGWGPPYDGFVPMHDDTRTAIGCVAIVMAQIMNYHKHPVRGIGQSTSYSIRSGTVPVVSFDVNYDWNNMLNSYRSDGSDSNQRQRDAVATLMYHVGVSIRMNYLVGGSAPSGNFARALVDNFGYDRSIQALRRSYFDNDAEYEAIIRSQLDAGLPVRISARNRTGGGDHSFIIDGYDDTGRFHANMGYKGQGDGWYFLNDMYQDLSFRHIIFINIKPDAGGVSDNELALWNFASSKTSVSQNELFTVNVHLGGVSNFSGGQLRVELVDNSIQGIDGEIAAVVGNIDYNALGADSGRTSTINCFVPETVPPGSYLLRLAARPTDGEWKAITRICSREGVHNYNISVTAGEANSGGYGMALTAFSAAKTSVSQNELFTVTATLRNIAREAFPGGQLGAALVDSSGRIVEVIGTINRNPLNSGAVSNSMTINCFIPETVRQGQYRLRIVVRPTDGQWKIATLALPDISTAINFTVNAGVPNGGGYGMALTAFTANKSSVSQNELFTVSGTFRNIAAEAFPGGQLGAALVDSSGRIVEVIGVINRNALNSGANSNAMTINCFVPDTVRTGQYRLMAIVRPANVGIHAAEWRLATLALPDISNAINFTVTAGVTNSSGYGMALTAFTAGSTAVSAGERFTVSGTFRNVAAEAFPGGQLGVALVDNNGNIIEVIGTINRNALNSGAVSNAMTINCNVPNSVIAGRYQLRIVVRPAGGQWQIAGLSVDNAPTSIDFMVR